MLPRIKTSAQLLSPHLINLCTTAIDVLRQIVVFLSREACFSSFLINVHTGCEAHSTLLFIGVKRPGRKVYHFNSILLRKHSLSFGAVMGMYHIHWSAMYFRIRESPAYFAQLTPKLKQFVYRLSRSVLGSRTRRTFWHIDLQRHAGIQEYIYAPRSVFPVPCGIHTLFRSKFMKLTFSMYVPNIYDYLTFIFKVILKE